MLITTNAEDSYGLFRGMLNCVLIYLYLVGSACWLVVGYKLLKLHLL